MLEKKPFSDTFMASLIWNTNPGQMLGVVLIMMKMAKEMDEGTDWNEYWSRVGFIKEQ